MRPIAVSRIALIPVARTFSAMPRNGALAGSGKAGTVSATIKRPMRAPCRIASSNATKAPNPLPKTSTVDGSESASIARATWSACSPTELNSTGSDAPKPGRLRQVTRCASASCGSTRSNTLISVSSECRSNKSGPLPVWRYSALTPLIRIVAMSNRSRYSRFLAVG